MSASSQPCDVPETEARKGEVTEITPLLNGEAGPSGSRVSVLKHTPQAPYKHLCQGARVCVQHVVRWVLVGRGWRCHEGKKEQGKKGILGDVPRGSMGQLPGSLKGP